MIGVMPPDMRLPFAVLMLGTIAITVLTALLDWASGTAGTLFIALVAVVAAWGAAVAPREPRSR